MRGKGVRYGSVWEVGSLNAMKLVECSGMESVG